MVIKTCIATREHESFECGNLEHTYTHVYINFSLEKAAWTRFAEGGVKVASERSQKGKWKTGEEA